jgi:hypothetical protein
LTLGQFDRKRRKKNWWSKETSESERQQVKFSEKLMDGSRLIDAFNEVCVLVCPFGLTVLGAVFMLVILSKFLVCDVMLLSLPMWLFVLYFWAVVLRWSGTPRWKAFPVLCFL